jgi:hypothetical protein
VAKRKTTKKKGFLVSVPKITKKSLLVFAAIFALIGSYFLYSAFAAQKYVNYYGVLTASNSSAEYKLSTGSGVMDVSFSNNTADVRLKIKNSKGDLVGVLDSRGKRDVKLSTKVSSDTYSFSLTTEKAFNKKKGYSVKINYPEKESPAPTVAIIDPFNNESVNGTSFISAKIASETGVKKVEITANGKIIKDDYEAPWETRWNTRDFEDGPVEIVVKAIDNDGKVGQASGTILVDNVEDKAEKAQSRFPGDPNPKVNNKAYWGAGIGGNGDPAKHEDPTGKSLSIRRTFHQWSHVTNMNSSMYKIVEDDIKNNRLPFISFKTPGWKDMGDGKYNNEIDAMLRKLDSYGKPVWLVAHHEPEGGGTFGNSPDDPGGPAQWRRMQTKVRERINAVGTKNVAFMAVTMTYTWNPASNRTPSDWWVEGVWDAYCVDHYAHKEGSKLLDNAWFDFVKWAENKNIPYCIGEWGNRGTDAAAGQLMREFWEWSFKNDKDMLAYTYFDSSLNSPGGSWELVGERLNAFRDILKSDSRVQRINDLD